jgi:pimeloyl-ACP methyl ester carboxylesterase
MLHIMATEENNLILADCSDDPLMVLPILDAQDHTGSTGKDVRITSYSILCNLTKRDFDVQVKNNKSPAKNFIQRQSFFVGGSYTGPESARVMRGQMYVEALTPEKIEHPLPLVLVHGGGQTAMNWTTTPDGRPGWAEWLAGRGWRVYIVDQPTRGRSAWQPDHDSPQVGIPASAIEKQFTAPRAHGSFAAAEKHTQWPGTGRVGDPVFDQYFASVIPVIDAAAIEPLTRDAGAALLDRIGPAIIISHSQGAQPTWLIGDARPDMVKGIVALEPSGPPYKDVPGRYLVPKTDRFYGLTTAPLRYDPEVTPSEPLEFEQEAGTGYWAQRGLPRRLVNLSRFPVVVVTTQASYHVAYDHLTVRYLKEAGVTVNHVRLEDHGILGNGHMMMLEKNSDEVVALVERLVVELVKS